jgi:hypothetical protein
MLRSSKRYFLICLFLIFTILTNLHSAENENKQTKSSIDIKSVQSRSYPDKYKDVFRSVVSMLQNNKFKIKFTDMNSGVISADATPEVSENMSQVAAAVGELVIPFFSAFRKEEVNEWSLSTNIEETVKGTMVRLTIIQEKRKDGFFTSAQDKNKADDLTNRPELYQALFAKIDKELFIRRSLK